MTTPSSTPFVGNQFFGGALGIPTQSSPETDIGIGIEGGGGREEARSPGFKTQLVKFLSNFILYKIEFVVNLGTGRSKKLDRALKLEFTKLDLILGLRKSGGDNTILSMLPTSAWYARVKALWDKSKPSRRISLNI